MIYQEISQTNNFKLSARIINQTLWIIFCTYNYKSHKSVFRHNICSSSNHKHIFAYIIIILSEKPRSIRILTEKSKLSLNQKIINLKCTNIPNWLEPFTTVWGITSQWLELDLRSCHDNRARVNRNQHQRQPFFLGLTYLST